METLVQQWLMLQKKALDNSFQSVTQIQDYVAEQVLSSVEKNPLIPEEGKKLIVDWAQAYRKGREDLRKHMDQNFQKVEGFFTEKPGR